MSFFTDYLADAKKASAATGVLTSVILAQWADETGSGGSSAFVSGNNYAGVSFDGLSSFASKTDGLNAYIGVLNHSEYDPVRSASGWRNQCVELGASPWAAGHYNANAYNAGERGAALLANAGIDLISIVNGNNLTQFDGPGGGSGGGSSAAASASALSAAFDANSVGALIQLPPDGFASTISANDIVINGTNTDLNVSNALAAPSIDLSISQASTLTLTLHDPDRVMINDPAFQEKSILQVGEIRFSLVSVEKQDSVITAIFESYVIAALRSAHGAFVATPGMVTRTAFARILVQQVVGAGFSSPPESYLYGLDSGYARPTQEQISRGTSTAPQEDSWTCLQRLADEIQWICFESAGIVYFGPYSWLALQDPVMAPVEFQGGIDTIDGTYDIGQPLGTLTVTCQADAWLAIIGDAVQINNLGPFNGIWIVSEMERDNLLEPDITITLMQPQPSLPEPASGGAAAAVSADGQGASAQSTGGSAMAQQALAYVKNQLGKPYVWGGESPTSGFDCSGLVQAAYASAGVPIPRTTETMFPTAAGPAVPPGIRNLLPGDLVFFGSTSDCSHVGMFVDANIAAGTARMIDAEHTGTLITYDTFDPTIGASWGGDLYLGALRPAP
jgi:cell wall-associated NlpC family hydrolase